MPTALTVAQILGFLGVLVGVALLLPLPWVLLGDGVLVLVAATVAEVVNRKAAT